MKLYQFDEAKYKWLLQNKHKVAWDDFAKAHDDISDWSCLANPYIFKGSNDYQTFRNYFKSYFGSNVYFPFVVRLVNSFMVVGATSCNNNIISIK